MFLFRQRYLGGTLLSQLLLVSTEISELPRLSTYMSLDYSGVRLELYLSGVYVYRDSLHCLLRGCVIRYPRKNKQIRQEAEKAGTIGSLPHNLGPGIKSRICIGI